MVNGACGCIRPNFLGAVCLGERLIHAVRDVGVGKMGHQTDLADVLLVGAVLRTRIHLVANKADAVHVSIEFHININDFVFVRMGSAALSHSICSWW